MYLMISLANYTSMKVLFVKQKYKKSPNCRNYLFCRLFNVSGEVKNDDDTFTLCVLDMCCLLFMDLFAMVVLVDTQEFPIVSTMDTTIL